MTCGVYRINIGERFYYGSSVDLETRKRHHLMYLRSGTHHNIRMQRSWDKYQSFDFTVVKETDSDTVLSVEQEYLDELGADPMCMNICLIAGSPRGYKHSEEAKQKISQASKGRRHSREARKKISEGNMGKRHTPEVKARIGSAVKARRSAALE